MQKNEPSLLDKESRYKRALKICGVEVEVWVGQDTSFTFFTVVKCYFDLSVVYQHTQHYLTFTNRPKLYLYLNTNANRQSVFIQTSILWLLNRVTTCSRLQRSSLTSLIISAIASEWHTRSILPCLSTFIHKKKMTLFFLKQSWEKERREIQPRWGPQCFQFGFYSETAPPSAFFLLAAEHLPVEMLKFAPPPLIASIHISKHTHTSWTPPFQCVFYVTEQQHKAVAVTTFTAPCGELDH